MNQANTYYLKAKEAINRHDFEEGLEQLSYCLSNDSEHTQALIQYGLLYMTHFEDYVTAIDYFDSAIASDNMNRSVWRWYLDSLVAIEEYEKAIKAFEYAIKIKGIDKAPLYMTMAYYYEKTNRFEDSLSMLEEAAFETYNEVNLKFISSSQNRVNFKIALVDSTIKDRNSEIVEDTDKKENIKEKQLKIDFDEKEN